MVREHKALQNMLANKLASVLN